MFINEQENSKYSKSSSQKEVIFYHLLEKSKKYAAFMPLFSFFTNIINMVM